MKQWWKNETIEAFQKRIECIIQQYSDVKLEQIDKNVSIYTVKPQHFTSTNEQTSAFHFNQ